MLLYRESFTELELLALRGTTPGDELPPGVEPPGRVPDELAMLVLAEPVDPGTRGRKFLLTRPLLTYLTLQAYGLISQGVSTSVTKDHYRSLVGGRTPRSGAICNYA